MDNMRMSGRNFSINVSITAGVVAVLDTRTHFVATLAPVSWKKKRMTPKNSNV